MKISNLLLFLTQALSLSQASVVPPVSSSSDSTEFHRLERRELGPCDHNIFNNVLGAFMSNFGRGGKFRGSRISYPNYRIACCSGWCLSMQARGARVRHWTDEEFKSTADQLEEQVYDREQPGSCMANRNPGYVQTVEGTQSWIMRLLQPDYMKRRREMYVRFMSAESEIWAHWKPGVVKGEIKTVGSRVHADSCEANGTVYEGPFVDLVMDERAEFNFPTKVNPNAPAVEIYENIQDPSI